MGKAGKKCFRERHASGLREGVGVGCAERVYLTLKNMKFLLSVASALAIVSSASASVLLSDAFSYTNGGLVAQSGGNWTNLSGSGTFLQVAEGEVAGIAHGSGSREDATRVFATTAIATGNNVFSSFSFTVNTAPTAGSDYFFAVHDAAASNFRGRVFLSAPSSSGFRIGISNSLNTPVFTSDLVTGQTYFAVVRHSNTTGVNSALWIGSSLSAISSVGASSPTITASDTLGTLIAFSRVALRQGNSITVANSLDFDNLVIGNTFADVAPIPEPSTYAAILGGVALLGVAARRRRSV